MYEYRTKVERVVDGDTIDGEIDLGFGIFIRERIRLNGIDTPETRTRNLMEKSWGLAAKERVIQLLEKEGNEFILLSKFNAKGKFGRILGEIMLPETLVSSVIQIHQESASRNLQLAHHLRQFRGLLGG